LDYYDDLGRSGSTGTVVKLLHCDDEIIDSSLENRLALLEIQRKARRGELFMECLL
jgi:hypothetical protein